MSCSRGRSPWMTGTCWKSPVASDSRLDSVIPLASSLDKKLLRSSPMPPKVGPKGPDVRFKPGAKLPKFMCPVKLVRAVMKGFALKLRPPPRSVAKELGLKPLKSGLNSPESELSPLVKAARRLFKPVVKPPRFGGLNNAVRFGKPPPRRPPRSPVLEVPPPPKRPPRSEFVVPPPPPPKRPPRSPAADVAPAVGALVAFARVCPALAASALRYAAAPPFNKLTNSL